MSSHATGFIGYSKCLCDNLLKHLPLFCQIYRATHTLYEDDVQILERFAMAMYFRSSEATCVNDSRTCSLSSKERLILSHQLRLPSSSLLYQAGCIWSRAIIKQLRFHWEYDRCKDGWNILRALCYPLQPAAGN
jgi:hypothetical protein